MCPEEVNGKPWSTYKTVVKNAQTSTKPGVGGGNGCASQHIRKGAFVHPHSRIACVQEHVREAQENVFQPTGSYVQIHQQL